MAHLGADNTLDALLDALRWKLDKEDGNVVYDGLSDSQRKSWVSNWSQKVDKSIFITSLLQERLQSLSTANWLPCEILGEIFLVLQSEYQNTSFLLPITQSDLNHANSWIRVTHVCRRWRRSARNNKALWRRIILNDRLKCPAFMAASFFKLSHPLPIELEQELGPLSHSEEVQMNNFYGSLLENPHRISALYLRGYLPHMAWELLQTPMPNLVEIEISFELRRKYDELLGIHASPLLKLSLKNFTWTTSQTFPALTHLYLTNQPADNWLPEEDFYAVLQALSSTLQYLYLEDTGPYAGFTQQVVVRPAADRILMPALKHLEVQPFLPYRIDEFDYTPLAFFHNLSLPNTTTFIWYWLWSSPFHEYSGNLYGIAMIPPTELLTRVKNVVGWARQRGCYVLNGETLYIDATHVCDYDFGCWAEVLPNVVNLILPPCLDRNRNVDVYHTLEHYKNLRSLYCWSYHDLGQLLLDLEKENPDYCSHLETIVAYAEHPDIWIECGQEIDSQLVINGLRPLELDKDFSTIRRRLPNDLSYTLLFKTGDISDVLTFTQLLT